MVGVVTSILAGSAAGPTWTSGGCSRRPPGLRRSPREPLVGIVDGPAADDGERRGEPGQVVRAGRERVDGIGGQVGELAGATLPSRSASPFSSAVPSVYSRSAAGAAEELEQRVPFAAISGCLRLSTGTDPQAAEVSALLRGAHRPSGGTFTAADAEFLITEAILGLVDGWCAAGAVVLAVDDLQWADQESLFVLHRLGRVAGQLPLLLAAARRSGAGGTGLERLVRSWEARWDRWMSRRSPA
jgi:hypothetical protein